ncbi:tryptophan 7-halogenase [Aliarcobacter butzleri]|uniref:flavin-dependent monooxygenase QhpG n=1 Tax=Aliarcobacter butzleri TaxID=28197 RepID=UPI0021B31057|nr:tryptophan 7-halogenase [Aliarcobacter butzleri]MCT7609522.1 tryptophan 7-halogenase [Aliarcobacter butzleri]
MNSNKKIVVLGAGIAGSSTAIGLKKLGFDVTVIYKKRPFTAYEGFSQKTKEGLISLGCIKASKLLVEQSLRNSNWASKTHKVNYEFVVNRSIFDKSLLEDLKEYQIKIIEAKVIGSVDYLDEKSKIVYKIDEKKCDLIADFVVDARGRFTPFKDEYICGPKSFSLLQELELEDINENQTSIDSVRDGWIWQAFVGNKRGYIQFSCDEELANKVNCFDDMLKILKEQNIELWSLNNYKVVGKLVKRDSFCKIHKEIINSKMMLIGDSASSVDPLSGNGAFQAMSMSSIAPFVINTILNKSEIEQKVAIDFYKSRVEFIFDKFTKVGKEFYLLENRFDTIFWQKRQTWTQDKNELEKKVPRIEKKAVVKDGFVNESEVVITKDNPFGACYFGNIEIIDLAKYCLENSFEKSLDYFDIFCKEKNVTLQVGTSLKNWCIKEEILG